MDSVLGSLLGVIVGALLTFMLNKYQSKQHTEWYNKYRANKDLVFSFTRAEILINQEVRELCTGERAFYKDRKANAYDYLSNILYHGHLFCIIFDNEKLQQLFYEFENHIYDIQSRIEEDYGHYYPGDTQAEYEDYRDKTLDRLSRELDLIKTTKQALKNTIKHRT